MDLDEVVALDDLVDLDLDRVRDLLARAVQHLLAHELGQPHVLGLIGDLLEREQARALGRELDQVLDERAEALAAAAALVEGAEVFPVSARTGAGVAVLVAHLATLLPAGPFYFPPEEFSDQPESVLLAELVREQVLARTRQEVPHSVEVQVDEVEERSNGFVVRASLWVETESQKGILIGRRGAMIKAIGTASRRELEQAVGMRVHLDLSVRVRRSWRADDALLDRLGIN